MIAFPYYFHRYAGVTTTTYIKSKGSPLWLQIALGSLAGTAVTFTLIAGLYFFAEETSMLDLEKIRSLHMSDWEVVVVT